MTNENKEQVVAYPGPFELAGGRAIHKTCSHRGNKLIMGSKLALLTKNVGIQNFSSALQLRQNLSMRLSAGFRCGSCFSHPQIEVDCHLYCAQTDVYLCVCVFACFVCFACPFACVYGLFLPSVLRLSVPPGHGLSVVDSL